MFLGEIIPPDAQVLGAGRGIGQRGLRVRKVIVSNLSLSGHRFPELARSGGKIIQMLRATRPRGAGIAPAGGRGFYAGRGQGGCVVVRGPGLVLVGGLALLATTAQAATQPTRASPKVMQGLLDCRKVADDAARLACYDKAAAAVDAATTSGDLVSIDREQRKAARRQAFGFVLPSLAFLDMGEKGEGADRINATVAEAHEDATGRWVVQLDDGAVWVQTESELLGRTPRKGSKVLITKGMLGAFFMTIDGQGAGRAKRIG
jgi:hypothetical protein